MLLYVCPECGAWQDVSLGKFLTDSWNTAFKGMPQAQLPTTGYPCPHGHGLMVQVQPNDRLFVRPAEIEAEVSEG